MTDLPTTNLSDRLAGLLLGTAVGDALGLPAENLSAKKIFKRWEGRWQMRFLFGKGMFSDDTEHTLMVAQALLQQPNDVRRFQRALAWKFRWWFAALPAGVGLATARACLELWLGFPPGASAVRSGGGGPAMRSAIIGACLANEPAQRREYVLASTRLTHRGWQAETAAQAVAECAALAVANRHRDPQRVLATLAELSTETEWQNLLAQMQTSLAAGDTVLGFVAALKLKRGLTGYALDVVPVAIYSWLRHPVNFRAAVTSALDCGGDTDTMGAIVGALAGASLGRAGIPQQWLDGIWEWPRSLVYLGRVAGRLARQKSTGRPGKPVRYFWPATIARNLIFLSIVLVHGFRRLLPPY
jgi:ADP-ribosyl-[dinitrogen reductase] hydrolase